MTKTKKKPEKAAPSGRKSQPYQNRPSKSRPRRSPSDEAQLEETQASKSPAQRKTGRSVPQQAKNQEKPTPQKRVISLTPHPATRPKEKAPTRVPTKALPRLRPPSDNDSNINQESEDKNQEDEEEESEEVEEANMFLRSDLHGFDELGETEFTTGHLQSESRDNRLESRDNRSDDEHLPDSDANFGSNSAGADEVQHDRLCQLFAMSNAEHRRAKELLNMTPEDQAAALFYHLIKVNSRLEKLELAARTQVQPAGAHGKAHEPAEPILFDPTAPIRIEAFTFDNSAKISIKGVARRAMLEGDLESYSSRKNSQGDMIRKSLLSVTSKSLVESSGEFKRDHLPPGFAAGNSHAMCKTFKLLSRVLKDERNIFRGCLLQNIKTSTVNKKISGPVPSLTKLMSHIIETFFRKELALLADSLNPTHAAQSRTRIAYSRMECIRYAFGDQETNAAQWGLIDPQLEFLRGQSLDYYRVWSELIIKKDDALFGSGRQVFDEIPTDETFHVTHEEVLKLQATQQEERE
ncbi:hypothetical protein PSTG_03555 [Puccinia striiformis f. sp. tritici PST-78]|uniref:Uncharacterized protein n=1 Tax=Puccinia striiformis f. sp. tritici PST-78 TaxID=1165861 RepID=A0A0L0VVH9_9BASI|nr:hypothetical protein PSTG_03555 [Puccinia striiformis f. sp. tritici PST-78]